jgi:hypothetical protein
MVAVHAHDEPEDIVAWGARGRLVAVAGEPEARERREQGRQQEQAAARR